MNAPKKCIVEVCPTLQCQLPMGPCYFCGNPTHGDLEGWWACGRTPCVDELAEADCEVGKPPSDRAPHPKAMQS